jgi:hypothetical protein
MIQDGTKWTMAGATTASRMPTPLNRAWQSTRVAVYSGKARKYTDHREEFEVINEYQYRIHVDQHIGCWVDLGENMAWTNTQPAHWQIPEHWRDISYIWYYEVKYIFAILCHLVTDLTIWLSQITWVFFIFFIFISDAHVVPVPCTT